MMVLRGSNTAGQGIPGTTGTARNIFPADRCTWQQAVGPNGNGYAITNARFVAISGNAITITNPELGYIGKSGRFVQIAS